MVSTASTHSIDLTFDILVLMELLFFPIKVFFGSELRKVLLAGLLSKGRGGYLQWFNVNFNEADKSFKINGSMLDDSRFYHIITTEFLFSGKETNFDFFTSANPNVSNVEVSTDVSDLRSDIRKALIIYLKNKK